MLTVRRLSRAETEAAFEDLARLRIAVFREYPYLYDGDMAYERAYLERFLGSPGAVVVGAFAGLRLVGAATASPLADHHAEFASPFAKAGLPVEDHFYFGESVLEQDWRGQGAGVRFFQEREAAAREGGFSHAAFCAVVRPPGHPARPAGYAPLDGFWERRGYARMPGLEARFSWKDVGEPAETEKIMEFWRRRL